MPAPPRDLFAAHPDAFYLWTQLDARPQPQLTAEQAAKIIGTNIDRARVAIRVLVDHGRLERAHRGLYRDPQPDAAADDEPALQRHCDRCHKPLPDGRWRFCSDECSRRFHKAQQGLPGAEARAAGQRCPVCDKTFIPRRARIVKYCSTTCKRRAQLASELQRDIAAGTANTCPTCGTMTLARTTYCSLACRPRDALGRVQSAPS